MEKIHLQCLIYTNSNYIWNIPSVTPSTVVLVDQPLSSAVPFILCYSSNNTCKNLQQSCHFFHVIEKVIPWLWIFVACKHVNFYYLIVKRSKYSSLRFSSNYKWFLVEEGFKKKISILNYWQIMHWFNGNVPFPVQNHLFDAGSKPFADFWSDSIGYLNLYLFMTDGRSDGSKRSAVNDSRPLVV